MSRGRKALEATPVAWRILLDGVWTDCYDPELVAKCRQCGYAVESLYTRQQLQDAYEDGVRAGHNNLTSWKDYGD